MLPSRIPGRWLVTTTSNAYYDVTVGIVDRRTALSYLLRTGQTPGPEHVELFSAGHSWFVHPGSLVSATYLGPWLSREPRLEVS